MSTHDFKYVPLFVRKIGVSDNEISSDMSPDNDEDEASDDNCHNTDKDEGIESIYDLDNYDSDKGDYCV